VPLHAALSSTAPITRADPNRQRPSITRAS
jgi:hypothetical protein